MIVVVFNVKMRADANLEEYKRWGERMYGLAQQIPGFISITSYPDGDRGEVSIVRFASEEALKAWRTHPEHLQAQELGRSTFYESYRVQVCRTIRDYEFHQDTGVTHRDLGKEEEPLQRSL